MTEYEPIHINPDNAVEIRLWAETYGDNMRAWSSRNRGSQREIEIAELSAAEAADRAVLALRRRTDPQGPITLEDTFDGVPQFG